MKHRTKEAQANAPRVEGHRVTPDKREHLKCEQVRAGSKNYKFEAENFFPSQVRPACASDSGACTEHGQAFGERRTGKKSQGLLDLP